MGMKRGAKRTQSDLARAKALKMFKAEASPESVAEELKIHPRTAWRWKQAFLKAGNLLTEIPPSSGRSRDLRKEELEQLGRLIHMGPRALGLVSPFWKTSTVQALIKALYGLSYRPDHVKEVMLKLGCVTEGPALIWRRPRPHPS